MKIVVDLNHPSDVHLFKNFIWKMKENGHDILIVASKKDVSIELLNNYNFNFINLGSYGSSLIKKLINIPILDLKMYKTVKNFKPDIFIGSTSIRNAHVSRLLKKPCINFNDTEHSFLEQLLYVPFSDVILTPSCYINDLGKRHIRINGYKELAYLNPKYFYPNPNILEEFGIEDENFIILRFVSWDASHDIGQYGIYDKTSIIKELEKYGRVMIISESKLDKKLEKYNINIPPEKLHDLLNYASLFIGEGATMAVESAILGTPSIYISSLVGKMGNLIELEQIYGLLYSFNNQNLAMRKAIELMNKPNIKEEWKKKKEILSKNKIDVTTFMIWFVENYPESFEKMKNNTIR